MSNAQGVIMGRFRGSSRRGAGGSDQDLACQLADGGELLIVQGLPPEAELARLGLGFVVVGSGVTPVAAIPTTAAHLSLYNGNTDKSLIIAAVGGLETTSTAAAGQFAMLVRNDVPTANANPAGTLIISGTNGANYGGAANAKASVTLAAIAAPNNVVWIPAGASVVRTAATGVATCAHHECYGRWIVRPQGLFSLATLAQTAAGTVQPYIYFYEYTFNNP